MKGSKFYTKVMGVLMATMLTVIPMSFPSHDALADGSPHWCFDRVDGKWKVVPCEENTIVRSVGIATGDGGCR
jgi:hypothetical protein